MYYQAGNDTIPKSYNVLMEWSKSTEVLGNIWYHKSLCIEYNTCIFDSYVKVSGSSVVPKLIFVRQVVGNPGR